jgi:ribokinase
MSETATNASGSVLVAGSIHMDEVIALEHAPGAGETVVATGSAAVPGGKGANQAVAAARWGASVVLVGRVGADSAGDALHELLGAEGIDTRWVHRSPLPSGRAIVMVEPSGENRIVVVPGASGSLPAGDVSALEGQLDPAVVVVQAEVSPEVTVAAAELAARAGARFVLNLAPYRDTAVDVVAQADPLVVNESELRALAGDAASELTEDAVRTLLQHRVRSAVVTLGSAGAVVLEDGTTTALPAPQVAPVDTTGAGDTLVGVIAAGLADGLALLEAARVGVLAASRSVTVAGAQASMPSRSQVLGSGE